MHTVTRISRLAAAAAIGISLAACGSSSGSGKTAAASPAGNSSSSSTAAPLTSSGSATDSSAIPDAKTLVHEARTASDAAKSSSLHADMTDSGDHEIIDLNGTLDGSNQDATMKTTEGSVAIRTVDSKTYVNGDKKFWTTAAQAPAAAASMIAGKWVIAPPSFAATTKDLTIHSFLSQTLGPSSISDAELATATVTRTTYQGQAAFVVTSAKTKNTITIAADTKYFLEINGEPGKANSPGKVTLSGWNHQPRVEAPTGVVPLPSSLAN